MSKLVIDASIAIKWVIDESGTPEALRLMKVAPLAAPDLLVAECANILWKKAQRGEMTLEEAVLAARLLQRADIEIHPTRHLMDLATKMAIEFEHPAYDCIYLSLAITNGWRFVTADERLLRKVRSNETPHFRQHLVSLAESATTSLA